MSADGSQAPPWRDAFRVLLYIGQLSAGGAERQFVELAKGMKRRGIDVRVLLNRPGGQFFSEIEAADIPIEVLHLGGILTLPFFYFRGWAAVRRHRPDVVYGFMGAGIKATVLNFLGRQAKIVWGIRNALSESYHIGIAMHFSSWLERVFSWHPSALICNSKAGAQAIQQRGFRNKRIRVVENGLDLQCFRFDSAARSAKRRTWGISDGQIALGLVGRLHPDKNHRCFIEAAARIARYAENVRLVCVGSGNSDYTESLMRYADQLGIGRRMVWAGHESGMASAYSALDILVSSSDTEAFPNVILEAMSVGLPVVATDVGDCRKIIGDRGWLVPPGNPEALAETMQTAIAAVPGWDRELSRQRIMERYANERMVDETLAVFMEVLNDP